MLLAIIEDIIELTALALFVAAILALAIGLGA